MPRAGAGPAGPQVKGFTQRSGWSDVPIDLSPLGLLDVDAKLSFGRLLYEQLKLGETQTTITLKDRVLRASFDEIRLYDGRGRGLLTADAAGKQPVIGANISLDGVSGLPLLKDAAGFDWIAGKTKLQLAFGGQGSTEQAIVESLTGKAEFAFLDGAIVGFNIPQILRGLGQGRISGLERTPTEKTDFREFAATYAIAQGVAQTQDLRIESPLLRAPGSGSVDLGKRQLDTTLRPKLVTNLPARAAPRTSPDSSCPSAFKAPGNARALAPTRPPS